MNKEDFAAWLQGYLDAIEGKPTDKQMKEIRNKLDKVLPTPYYLPSTYPTYPNWWKYEPSITVCSSSDGSKDFGIITTYNQAVS